MNLKLLLPALLISLFSFTSVFASFPVVKTTTQTANVNSSEVNTEETLSSPAAVVSYNKWIAVALWFFLGLIAAHRWYAGKPIGWNLLFIFTLGGLGIWAIIDVINILTDNFS